MSSVVECVLLKCLTAAHTSSCQPTYQLAAELKHAKGPINAIAFSKDAKLLLVGGDDGYARVYNTTTFECEQTLSSSSWGQVTTVSWLLVEPPVNERATSACVGTGRGVVTLCPMARTNTWLVWKDSVTVEPFRMNDAVECQAYDPLNCRLALASHSGVMKVYTVEKCVNVTLIWSATMDGAIPRGVKFFGGANQSLLVLGLETGDMVCRDAQTSNVQWTKHLVGGIGHAALAPDESTLVVDNLTNGKFDIYRFPSSTPAITLPFSSARRFLKQCTFSEEGKFAVCGSDHGKVYVTDVATGESRESLQTAEAFDLIQAVAAATDDVGRCMIAAGTSTSAGRVYIWAKRPVVAQPSSTATVARREFKIGLQGFLNICFAVVLVCGFYPSWAPLIKNSTSTKHAPVEHIVPSVPRAAFVPSHAPSAQEIRFQDGHRQVINNNGAHGEGAQAAVTAQPGHIPVIETFGVNGVPEVYNVMPNVIQL